MRKLYYSIKMPPKVIIAAIKTYRSDRNRNNFLAAPLPRTKAIKHSLSIVKWVLTHENRLG